MLPFSLSGDHSLDMFLVPVFWDICVLDGICGSSRILRNCMLAFKIEIDLFSALLSLLYRYGVHREPLKESVLT